MPVAVKICGLSTPETLDAAIAAGADYVGLTFFPRSPRNVTPDQAARLAEAARGRAKIVALMVDRDDGFISGMVQAVRPDLLQLHGSESPERVVAIRGLVGLPVMKAIKVAMPADVAAAEAYHDVADLILFDAKTPPGRTDLMPGGNGMPFDWRLLAGVKRKDGFMLSGGLTPDNVAEAILASGARMVDVSSGVESAPGTKDPELIRRFIAAARSAAAQA